MFGIDYFNISESSGFEKLNVKINLKKNYILHFQWTISTFQVPPILKKKCENQAFKNFVFYVCNALFQHLWISISQILQVYEK